MALRHWVWSNDPKRTRESLAHRTVRTVSDPCSAGRGENGAYRLLRNPARALARASSSMPAVSRDWRPNVIDLFLDEESQGLAMLSDSSKSRCHCKPGQLFAAVRHYADVIRGFSWLVGTGRSG